MNPQLPPLFTQLSTQLSTQLFSPLSTHEKVGQLIQLSEILSSKNSDKNSDKDSYKNSDEIQYTYPCLLLSKTEPNSSELSKPAISDKASFNQQTQINDQGFSFLMLNPSAQKHLSNKEEVETWHQQVSEESNRASRSASSSNNSPTNTSANSHQSSHIPFHSGWVGYYPYPDTKVDNSTQLLAEFYYYSWSICLDHGSGLFHLLGSPDPYALEAFEKLREMLKTTLQQSQAQAQALQSTKTLKAASPFKPVWDKADYERAFYKIQDYLKAGDCYQVNLTQPHHAKYTSSALSTVEPLYSALNPSFGCYFEGRDCKLVSVSPERFMSINADGRIEAKPIKGTIKRSSNKQQDQHYINELTHSSKNQAENLMIVDLLRNDLSMSAEPNSVKVEKLFELETHPNVHHLVSTISGQLKIGLTPADAISKAFPGGSITGAPKKRAMEIIEELEAQPRSLYCGSFGYYSDSGHTDFNILIRSVEFRGDVMTCWGGGGITVDSNCDEEYEESLTKVRKIMEVIEGL